MLPPSQTSLTGPWDRAAQCHGTRFRLCRCAASGPSSVLSLTRSRNRAAHSVTTAGAQRLAWPGSPRCRSRIPTSRVDGQQVVPSTSPETRRWPYRFSPAPATLARPLSVAAGFIGAFTLLFLLSCARRPVRAGPGLSPADPAAGRSPRRPGLRGNVTAGDVTSPPGPPAEEPSC